METLRFWVCSILLLFLINNASALCQCEKAKVCVQILGSGGPIADDERASSSYLVWINGKAKIMIDLGTGSFYRYGTTNANFNDLEIIGITHMHVDHVNDLPAFMKQGYFTNRKGNLLIIGPTGTEKFPSLTEYLGALFDSRLGAYKYLSEYYKGDGNSFRLIPRTVNIEIKHHQKIADTGEYYVETLPVNHANIPTLAYRIKVANKIIVFSSDQQANQKELVKFIQNADLLITHFPIPEHASDIAQTLHATPTQIARLAQQSHAKHVVLSHFMDRSLRYIDKDLPTVRKIYTGKLTKADDLMCIAP